MNEFLKDIQPANAPEPELLTDEQKAEWYELEIIIPYNEHSIY
jgi:hypothetical protein